MSAENQESENIRFSTYTNGNESITYVRCAETGCANHSKFNLLNFFIRGETPGIKENLFASDPDRRKPEPVTIYQCNSQKAPHIRRTSYSSGTCSQKVEK